MLTVIYVREKLRDLEAESNRRPRHAQHTTATSVKPKTLIGGAGMTLRGLGQRLESWLASRVSHAEASPVPTPPTSG